MRGLAVVLALGSLSFGEPQHHPIHLRYTSAHREVGRYQYVPFDVPEGTTSLTIAYSYDKAGGANVIDLGLFEPGPLHLGTPSFRGWSGGERSEVTVSASSATPGYWPGPIPPGTWHVMLGLYKIADPGVDVELSVQTGRNAPGPPANLASPSKNALRRGPAWYAGALHTHTIHSDGTLTARELVKAARAEGLDFIAITDHNNTTHQLEGVEEEGVLHIVGEEVTTPGGHASVWGLSGPRAYVDFRVLRGDERVASLVQAAQESGALFSINHPRSACLGCSWEHSIPEGVVGIEVSNIRHEERQAAVKLWDSLLKDGRRLTAIGSSDWHRGPQPLGAASVRVWAEELSTSAILEGIRSGRLVVMADARTPPPVVTARAGKELARIGDTLAVRAGEPIEIQIETSSPAYEGGRVELYRNGELVTSVPLGGPKPTQLTDVPLLFSHGRIQIASAQGYVRAEIFGADGTLLALTNPIYILLQ